MKSNQRRQRRTVRQLWQSRKVESASKTREAIVLDTEAEYEPVYQPFADGEIKFHDLEPRTRDAISKGLMSLATDISQTWRLTLQELAEAKSKLLAFMEKHDLDRFPEEDKDRSRHIGILVALFVVKWFGDGFIFGQKEASIFFGLGPALGPALTVTGLAALAAWSWRFVNTGIWWKKASGAFGAVAVVAPVALLVLFGAGHWRDAPTEPELGGVVIAGIGPVLPQTEERVRSFVDHMVEKPFDLSGESWWMLALGVMAFIFMVHEFLKLDADGFPGFAKLGREVRQKAAVAEAGLKRVQDRIAGVICGAVDAAEEALFSGKRRANQARAIAARGLLRLGVADPARFVPKKEGEDPLVMKLHQRWRDANATREFLDALGDIRLALSRRPDDDPETPPPVVTVEHLHEAISLAEANEWLVNYAARFGVHVEPPEEEEEQPGVETVNEEAA